MKSFALNAVVSLLVVACGLLAYDRIVFRPSQVIGIVDVSDVYRAKEAEFASLVTASRSDEDRQRAQDLATSFARRLPQALGELPAECGCLVVIRDAIAGPWARSVDLTPRLKAKLESRS